MTQPRHSATPVPPAVGPRSAHVLPPSEAVQVRGRWRWPAAPVPRHWPAHTRNDCAPHHGSKTGIPCVVFLHGTPDSLSSCMVCEPQRESPWPPARDAPDLVATVLLLGRQNVCVCACLYILHIQYAHTSKKIGGLHARINRPLFLQLPAAPPPAAPISLTHYANRRPLFEPNWCRCVWKIAADGSSIDAIRNTLVRRVALPNKV